MNKGSNIGNKIGKAIIAIKVKIKATIPIKITLIPVATIIPKIAAHITTTAPIIMVNRPAPMVMMPPSKGNARCQATTMAMMINSVIANAANIRILQLSVY